MTLRSFLYWAARLIGDFDAVRKGPKALVKRLVRKQVHKRVGSKINEVTK